MVRRPHIRLLESEQGSYDSQTLDRGASILGRNRQGVFIHDLEAEGLQHLACRSVLCVYLILMAPWEVETNEKVSHPPICTRLAFDMNKDYGTYMYPQRLIHYHFTFQL